MRDRNVYADVFTATYTVFYIIHLLTYLLTYNNITVVNVITADRLDRTCT